MRKLLVILFTIGLLSGCLATHNTDGKHRPDERQHAAHVASYVKCQSAIEAIKANDRRPRRSVLEIEADDAWASRDLSWGEYQRHVMKDYYFETAEVIPVKTTTETKKPELSKPKPPKGKVY